jgi:hypothetical protein
LFFCIGFITNLGFGMTIEVVWWPPPDGPYRPVDMSCFFPFSIPDWNLGWPWRQVGDPPPGGPGWSATPPPGELGFICPSKATRNPPCGDLFFSFYRPFDFVVLSPIISAFSRNFSGHPPVRFPPYVVWKYAWETRFLFPLRNILFPL